MRCGRFSRSIRRPRGVDLATQRPWQSRSYLSSGRLFKVGTMRNRCARPCRGFSTYVFGAIRFCLAFCMKLRKTIFRAARIAVLLHKRT